MSRFALCVCALLYVVAAVGQGVTPHMRIVFASYATANIALAWSL